MTLDLPIFNANYSLDRHFELLKKKSIVLKEESHNQEKIFQNTAKYVHRRDNGKKGAFWKSVREFLCVADKVQHEQLSSAGHLTAEQGYEISLNAVDPVAGRFSGIGQRGNRGPHVRLGVRVKVAQWAHEHFPVQ